MWTSIFGAEFLLAVRLKSSFHLWDVYGVKKFVSVRAFPSLLYLSTPLGYELC